MAKAKSPVQLRPAVPEDAAMISQMIHELAIYERAPEDCHATPESVRERLFGPRPFAEAIIAEYKGEIAGFAIFFHNFSTWECAPGLYLEDLFVRPAYRRRAIGRHSLRYLANLAVERGCKRFEWAVLDWNKPARDFYQSLGARGLDEWVLYRLDGAALEGLAKGLEAAPGDESAAPSPAEEEKPKAGPKEPVVIHTDGGSQPNPGVGGWAAVLRSVGRIRRISGGELGTTNNRMELMAAIRGLESLKRRCTVELHTDSSYLRQGITSWIKKWKMNDWRRGKGRDLSPVKNADLWRRLDDVCLRHDVTWHWLKGHAGHADNELCDHLCEEEIRRVVQNSTPAEREKALEQELQRRAEDEAR